MAIEIELPDGTILEAPDDADPSVVAKGYFSRQQQAPAQPEAPQAQQPSFLDKAREFDLNRRRDLQAIQGSVARGGLGLFTLPVDAAVSAFNYATGQNNPNASEMLVNLSDRAGLPRLTGAADFVGQAIGGAMAGTFGQVPKPPPGAPLATPKPARLIPQQAQAVIQEGEKRGVPVFYDDVTQSAVAKRIGVTAEPLGPIGTGAGRARQAEAAQNAAETFVGSRAPVASDDVPELVQKGLKAKLGQFRKSADNLYRKAETALDPLGPVPTSKFDNAIDQAIANEQRFGSAANADVIATLESFKNAPRGNFSFMRQLRSQLGDKISTYYKGGSAIGDKGVGSLQSAREALEADMAAFARQSGGAGYQAWKTADGFYKANIVPFKVAGFRDLAKSPEPEKAWRYLLANGGMESRSARLYNSLDTEGRAAIRYGLLKDALDAGKNPNGSFSPAKFAKYLEDHQAPINTFFKGTDLQEIKGFQNLMRHIERAGQFAENPPTGQRLIPLVMLGGAALSPTAAAVGITSGVGTRALFQTPAGRNLLLGMSKATAGTPQMANLAARAMALGAAVGGTGAPRSNRAQEQQAQPAQ